MGLTTLSPRLVSISKFWKLAMKCKNNVFSGPFSQSSFLRLAFFLNKCLSNQLSFFVAVLKYKILDFDEAFFFLATVAMITET